VDLLVTDFRAAQIIMTVLTPDQVGAEPVVPEFRAVVVEPERAAVVVQVRFLVVL
jgi:hypothetical protein